MPDEIIEALASLKTDQERVLEQARRMLEANNGKLFYFDLLVMGIIKRTVALSDGFGRLIHEQNFICAGALIRMQLDTAFRLSAGYIVKSPHKFAASVMDGIPVYRMKDKMGIRMRDSYLVDVLSKEYPWVKSVYEHTSGFIHFSDIHIFSTADLNHNTDGSTTSILIGPKDSIVTDQDYLQAISVFHDITCIIMRYIEGWVVTKSKNPGTLE